LCWQDAFAAKYEGKGTFRRAEWDALLGHCQAVCDWPAIAFSKELIEAYPEAKVIITTRDVDTWHESVLKTVHWRANDPELRTLANFDWGAGLYQPMLAKFFHHFFKDDFPGQGKQIFHDYYQEIRDLVPPGQLLEYRVSSGWRPLCEYLGHPVPDTEFPRSNDADGFVQRCRAQNRKQAMNVIFRLVVVSHNVLRVKRVNANIDSGGCARFDGCSISRFGVQSLLAQDCSAARFDIQCSDCMRLRGFCSQRGVGSHLKNSRFACSGILQESRKAWEGVYLLRRSCVRGIIEVGIQ
jgi:hypothetical protein